MIGEYLFAYCDFLQSVTIEEGITAIGKTAFFDCNSLTDIWYGGSKTDFDTITIGSSNKYLINANWHYGK